MLKATRRNLVLLGILALLAAAAFLLPEDMQVPDYPRLLDTLPESVRVEQRTPDGWLERYHLYREGDTWFVSAPGRAPLPAATVRAESARHMLLAPSRRSWNVDEIPAEQTGLDQPGYRVIADGEEFFIGKRGALGNQRYVSDGSRVLLVDDVISYHLQRGPETFLPPDHRPEPTEQD